MAVKTRTSAASSTPAKTGTVTTLPAVQVKTNSLTKAHSLVDRLAAQYGVDPQKFLEAVVKTCFSSKDRTPLNEEIMAFLVIADQYKLNPFLRQIYAFLSTKANKIVPIVGIDGWAALINQRSDFDGIATEYGFDEESKNPVDWCKATLYVKGRSHPTVITEFYDECYRDTDPWNSHPRRMLRHKTIIQCARIGFGIVGVYDEDEGERIIEMAEKEGKHTPIEIGVQPEPVRTSRRIVEPEPEAAEEAPGEQEAADEEQEVADEAEVRSQVDYDADVVTLAKYIVDPETVAEIAKLDDASLLAFVKQSEDYVASRLATCDTTDEELNKLLEVNEKDEYTMYPEEMAMFVWREILPRAKQTPAEEKLYREVGVKTAGSAGRRARS